MKTVFHSYSHYSQKKDGFSCITQGKKRINVLLRCDEKGKMSKKSHLNIDI